MEKPLSSNQEHVIQVLLEKNPALDEGLLTRAVKFIADAHSGQFRKSGMPYTEHPFEVAKILADLKLDTSAILAGLLHDVVEDTPHTLKEISSLFGEDTSFMVDAVTKISAAQKSGNKLAEKAETYRKLVSAMAKDPRVILIKIADRLHNMRTMRYMKPEKRTLIAQETLDIYIPLTHRFGLYKFKSELEDLSFQYVNPAEYQKIVEALIGKKEERETYIKSVIGPLQFKMALEELNCSVQGRTKNIYSIYQKMLRRNCPFDEIFDIFAVRIIVDSVENCYLALGYVHNLWTPLQSRFKDYIATPKSNLYQSIHTTVIGPSNKMVEVQIRTQDMDVTAEKGFAAHWAYKIETERNGGELAWLAQMAKLQEEIPDSIDFLNFLKADLKPEGMTVFTPKGEAIELPVSATVLDFAFAVHTELGLHCIGAKINEDVIHFDKPIPSGATVQILKSPSQVPSPEWLNIVKTVKAKQELKRWLRTSISEQAEALGQEIWKHEIRKRRISKEMMPSEEAVESFFRVPFKKFIEQLGQSEISQSAIQSFLSSYELKENSTDYMPQVEVLSDDGLEPYSISIENNASAFVHFASCCQPIPNEKIVGVIVPHRGLEVHNRECEKIKSAEPERLLPVNWKTGEGSPFDVILRIEMDNRKGITADILSEVNRANVAIVSLSAVSVKFTARLRIKFKAFRKKQLEDLVSSIKKIEGIREITL